ncbi:hypothetical protein ACVWW9_001066 [Agrococcus sp. UYP33]
MEEQETGVEPAIVELMVMERERRPDLLKRLRALLHEDRLVGVLRPFEAMGEVTCLLVVDDAGRAARATPDGLGPGLALDVVAARVSRALDAAVLIDVQMLTGPRPALPPTAEEHGEIVVDLPGFDPAIAAEARASERPQGRTLALVHLAAEAVLPRLPELAQSASARTVVVPAGDRSIIVFDAPVLPMWWRAALPVVSMIVDPSSVALFVATRSRVLGPDVAWSAGWADGPVVIQPETAHPQVLAAQRALYDDDGPMEIPDAALVAALGWDLATVEALRSIPSSVRADPATIVAAIDGPPVMAVLAHDEDAALQPGATAYVPRGAGATLLDAVALAVGVEPTGDSGWSRWERWWWRRPRLSIVAGVVMLVLAALTLGRMAMTEDAPWWRIALVIALSLNGVGILAKGLLVLRRAATGEQPR